MDAKVYNNTHSFPGKVQTEKAKRIIQRIFRDYKGGIAIRLGDSEAMTFGQHAPTCTLVFKRLTSLRNLILSPNPLNLAEVYFREWGDIEGDIYSALQIRNYLQSLNMPAPEKILLWLSALLLGESADKRGDNDASWVWSKPLTESMHSKNMNREAIGFHYDVSNAFYKLWLDERMIYSSAYFENAEDSLEDAQKNKLDLICRKLRLMPGDRLLDIGCGWGSAGHLGGQILWCYRPWHYAEPESV